MDGMLSQEEINALLNGAGDNSTPDEANSVSNKEINDAEKDAVGEISNICMGTAATTLSTLLNTRVTITTPEVRTTTLSELSDNYDRPCVFVQISYIEGLDGKNILILREEDVKIITDLMMGGDGTNTGDELSELHLSAISEAMNQMMGSASTSLSSMLDKKIDISPPVASLVDLNESFEDESLSGFLENDFVRVAFRMQIGDLVDSQIMQLYPLKFARDLYKKFIGGEDMALEAPQPQAAPQQPVQPQADPVQPQPQPVMGGGQPMDGQQMMSQPMMGQPMMGGQPMMPYGMPAGGVNVQPVQFQAFNQVANPAFQQENIDLIMDVPLEVTVELGRTNKSIKEILDFSPGTIIELNKLAGEPVDVLVNGKFVAKGEVVVIEESFGIRVTEILR